VAWVPQDFGEKEEYMAVNVFRHDNLAQLDVYESRTDNVNDLINLLRERWAYLRELGLAADRPIAVMKADRTAAEIFRWSSEISKKRALALDKYRRFSERIAELQAREVVVRTGTEAVRGFSTQFPITGGVEFLQGVCSCRVDVDGIGKDFVIRAIDGVVLMHRSPKADLDQDGKTEMYLNIMYHACALEFANLGPSRIEQNFDVPNDGIVKSLGEGDRDFPGTAIWRVAWKFKTPMGVLVTDPSKPLVFGPGRVTHYPPVGTEFRSPTGPVALLHQESGKRVGTLTPEELTAFDILATRDDEVNDPVLNTPPKEVFELLREYSG
jgi:hypothetical protein